MPRRSPPGSPRVSTLHGKPADAATCEPSERRHIVILSASMGAGHDGAAHELAARIRQAGHDATVRDLLDAAPLRIGAALRRVYEFELRRCPRAYEATYRLWYRAGWLCPALAWLVTALAGSRVRRWIAETRAAAVVSTYPLATICLGRMRLQGRVAVPVANYITDFGVHPLWTHPGVDLNLAVHESAASDAVARSGSPSISCGPAVAAAFHPDALPRRAAARESIGIPKGATAVIIAAGSWGVGEVGAAWDSAIKAGVIPVVLCGGDAKLFQRARAMAAASPHPSVVLPWTSLMPTVMAACDALIDNAGGLTSMEAMRAGLPVISFRPIAGHGKENSARMADAGVSRFARDGEDLVQALRSLTHCDAAWKIQVKDATSMFNADPSREILKMARAEAGGRLEQVIGTSAGLEGVR